MRLLIVEDTALRALLKRSSDEKKRWTSQIESRKLYFAHSKQYAAICPYLYIHMHLL